MISRLAYKSLLDSSKEKEGEKERERWTQIIQEKSLLI